MTNSPKANPLKGKIALVTASSSGIGYACAESLSFSGAKVLICSHNKNKISNAANKIKIKTGNEVIEFTCDLTNRENIESFISNIIDHFKKIDILVYNHGNPTSGNFTKISLKKWESSFSQILLPAFILTKHIIPIMKKNKWGRIFFINSIFAKEPDPDYIISSTFRAALLAYSKCLSKELASSNIAINSILPGYTDTQLLRNLLEKESKNSDKAKFIILKSWLSKSPLNKLIDPTSIGELICHLAKQKDPIITGSSIPIDGGFLNSF